MMELKEIAFSPPIPQGPLNNFSFATQFAVNATTPIQKVTSPVFGNDAGPDGMNLTSISEN